MRIDMFNRSCGRWLSRGTCERAESTSRISVTVQTRHFDDRPTAVSQTHHPAPRLGAWSMP